MVESMNTLLLIVTLAQIYNPPPLPPPNVGQRETQQQFWQRQEIRRDTQERYYDRYLQDQRFQRQLDNLQWDSWQRQQNDKDKR